MRPVFLRRLQKNIRLLPRWEIREPRAMVCVHSGNGLRQMFWVRLKRSFAGQTDQSGHREFHGQIQSLLYRRNSTGIYGWVPLRRPIILITWCLLTGVDGGDLEPEPWVTWVVIL